MTLPRGLYAIPPTALCADDDALLVAVRAALQGGAVMIQYRDKSTDSTRRHRQAAALRTLCADFGVPFIVNDDLGLAAAVGADGVHLGQSDGDPALARQRLGATAIVGVSCGPSLARVLAAEAAGASYAAIGRFHPSATKPEAPAASLDDLRAAGARVRLPLCAIGGITPRHVPPLLAAGAQLVAAVGGVFAPPFTAQGIRSAAAAYAAVFDAAPPAQGAGLAP